MTFREITYESIVVRLLSAIIVGGLIGLERGMKNRPAGLRTYMLVCIGSCLIMLTNQYIYQYTGAGDPMRLGAQVVSGIGFLGAGTIIVTGRQEVKGLTTAAALWASACMGLAIGAGFCEGVLAALITIIAVVRVLPALEAFILTKARNIHLYIEFETLADVGRIITCLKAQDARIHEVELRQKEERESSHPGAFFSIRLSRRQPHTELLLKLSELGCVYLIEEL